MRVRRRPHRPVTGPELMGQSRPVRRNPFPALSLGVNPLLPPGLPQPQNPPTPSPPRNHNARSPLAIRAMQQIHPAQRAPAALPRRSRSPVVPRRLGMPQPQAINPITHTHRGPTLSPARNQVPRAQPPGPHQPTTPSRPRRLCQVSTQRSAIRKQLRRNFLESRSPYRIRFPPPLASPAHRHRRRAKGLPPETLILPSLRHVTPQRIASRPTRPLPRSASPEARRQQPSPIRSHHSTWQHWSCHDASQPQPK
ncbi:hypothetical protein MSTE_04495 [Mycobacteroides stephanolepidis]|uniref:Uncharacterized protein n=1 Tax=[Mycobacterium] stephanolepidis TaxID=1520670 RepID=A0A1Z4F3L0_9MYCO|nr:hypothetical protein MSTE_04495 [[Mycobacterium] stephanolepidis]